MADARGCGNVSVHRCAYMGVAMHTLAALHGQGPRSDEVRVSVVLEGLAAFLGLIAVVGAVCGALTWGLVRLLTLALS